MRVAALISGEPRAPELWTLRKLAALNVQLYVLRARRPTSGSRQKRLQWLGAEYGWRATASRVLAGRLIGIREGRKERERWDRLFDGEFLRAWWRQSGIAPVDVPYLNHDDARAALEALQPDIIVRVSGGILKRHIFSLARLATLNIHHGRAPFIRGMWSIHWGIVEGRVEWIGATLHLIDEGIDTGRILWRGAPQLALGDTGAEIFFRAHLEAVEALCKVIQEYAAGSTPDFLPVAETERSEYRSAPGLWAWWKYLRSSRGCRAPVIVERAVKC